MTYHVASGYHIKWRGSGAVNETWGNYLCRVSGDRYEKIHLRLMPPQRNDRIIKIRFLYPDLRLKIKLRVLKSDSTKFVETVRPVKTADAEENLLTYERESLTGNVFS